MKVEQKALRKFCRRWLRVLTKLEGGPCQLKVGGEDFGRSHKAEVA